MKKGFISTLSKNFWPFVDCGCEMCAAVGLPWRADQLVARGDLPPQLHLVKPVPQHSGRSSARLAGLNAKDECVYERYRCLGSGPVVLGWARE